jgi:hypothetical protein
MRRVQAVELEDLSWFPAILRDAGMAYLRFAADRSGQAAHIRPVIESALELSGEQEIVDLCSGGGGPVVEVARSLIEAGRQLRVTMTDRFPSESARARLDSMGAGGLRYEAASIDATEVPVELPGLRTLFNAFHHFPPPDAVRILASAVTGRRPIVVVEVLQRHPLALAVMLIVPLVVLFVVPFLRPFRPAWLLFTYVIPVIPLFIMWDGLVSTLRVYTGDELMDLVSRADPERSYDWHVEEIPIPPSPVSGIALTGIPKDGYAPS